MKRVTMVAALIGMALASESSGLHRMGSPQRPSVRMLVVAVRRMRVRVPQRLVSMPMAVRLRRVDGLVMRVIVVLVV